MPIEPDQAVEFVGLPERTDPATWVEETPGEPVPDPSGGRDTETDFILRNAG
jgi:hypothetical protein